MVCLHASNVVSSERSRQTLDVLLATPIPGRALLIEKLAGVRRLLGVLTIPFATIVLFQHWYRDYKWDLSYVAQQAALVAILGWTLSWLAFRVGLATRSAVSAMFTSFGVALAICGVPILLSFAARSFLRRSIATELVALLSLNPATLIRMVESPTALDERAAQGWPPGLYPWGFGVAMLGYLGLGLLIRRRCLRNADRLLGRAWTEPSIDKSSSASDVATSPEANEQSLPAEIHMEPL
jgi:ABC-type transport system involved in multi-copper enzyme maturation permease subunit